MFGKNKTLTQILSGFNKTLTDLSELVKANDKKVGENEIEVAQLQAENEQLTTESKQAQAVAENISKLLQSGE